MHRTPHPRRGKFCIDRRRLAGFRQAAGAIDSARDQCQLRQVFFLNGMLLLNRPEAMIGSAQAKTLSIK